jgi:hypothetical protein
MMRLHLVGRELAGRKRSRFVAGAATAMGVALLCAAAGAPVATGCTTRQCGTSFVCIYPHTPPLNTCQPNTAIVTLTGDQVYRDGDELVWYSNAFNGEWLDFNGLETLNVFYPPEISMALAGDTAAGGVPTSVIAWTSSDPEDAAVENRNFTQSSGQLAEFPFMNQNVVQVLNASCAHYSVRLEVRAAIPPTMDTGAIPPLVDGGSGDAEAAIDGQEAAITTPSNDATGE